MGIKFVDLFAGIGGFHQAIKRVDKSAECIVAVEFDKSASEVYKETYNELPLGDITSKNVIKELNSRINENGIDILFAGFPCQTFSKAGNREGFNDQTRGTLFFSIKEVLKTHKPKYFVLENVRNLINHKSGDRKSFDIIQEELKNAGYSMNYSILSPHRLNNNPSPQMRERVFIYGIYGENQNKLDSIKKKIEDHFGTNKDANSISITNNKQLKNILNNKNNKEYLIEEERMNILNIWEELVSTIGNKKLISPIWLDVIFDKNQQNSTLEWKQNIINKNLKFYEENIVKIDKWYEKHNKLKGVIPSNRKFEWNANSTINSLFDGIIQFRPSGIRVKKPNFFPTFVAINHKPIIGENPRYLTPDEILGLYGFEGVKLGDNLPQSYKQLGNTISVDVAEIVIKELIK